MHIWQGCECAYGDIINFQKFFLAVWILHFRVVVIILLMLNMLVIIVVMLNILIGQLSSRYEKALEGAQISYDVDRTKIVTKIENSRFRSFVSDVYWFSKYVFGKKLRNILIFFAQTLGVKYLDWKVSNKRVILKCWTNFFNHENGTKIQKMKVFLLGHIF